MDPPILFVIHIDTLSLSLSRIIETKTMSSSSSSISTSLRIFTTRQLLSPNPSKPTSLFYKPITLHRKPLSKTLFSLSSTPAALQPINELPPKLQEIVKLFQSVQEPKAKYQQLLFYGKNLKPLETQFKTRENKVDGCVSQVWVRAFLDEEKRVVFEADSDSVLTKGLAALLVQGLSNRPVEEVVRVSPDFVVLLGLQQSLTPSRNNGFLNMLKLMQKKALELVLEAERNGGGGKNSILDVEDSEREIDGENSGSKVDEGGKVDLEREIGGENSGGGLSYGADAGGLGSRRVRIRERLEKELRPVELEVEDVSYQHSGHAGVRGSDGETHFNLRIVCDEFEGKSLVKRHRLIYDLLQEELQSGLHALSIVAKTPSEV